MSDLTNRAGMRQRGEWMVPSDDQILELVAKYGNLTPHAVEDLGGPTQDHAGKRCRELVRYGLLERISRGLYGLTDEGAAYLRGDLDADALEREDVDFPQSDLDSES